MKRFIFIPGGVTGFWVGGTGRSKNTEIISKIITMTASLLLIYSFFFDLTLSPIQLNPTQPNSTQTRKSGFSRIQDDVNFLTAAFLQTKKATDTLFCDISR